MVKEAVALELLLVCPVCQGPLHRKNDESVCENCGHEYRWHDGILDATPAPPPDQDVAEKWGLWEQLQANGEVSYTEAPDLNLSIGKREDAKFFGDFADLSGLTLDIGCGPQELPSYGAGVKGGFIGIDPLMGRQPRDFAFVKGIGEYLPFADNTFDRALFATSLDHMLSPVRALKEAARVVKPGGGVAVWYGEVHDHQDEPKGSYFTKAAAMLKRGDIAGLAKAVAAKTGLTRNRRAYMERLQQPEGAVDIYHFFHVEDEALREWIAQVGLTVAREGGLGANQFVYAVKG